MPTLCLRSNVLHSPSPPTSTKPNSSPPVSLHGQLLWREYNYLHGYATPNFDRMVGNPSARQIQWDDDPALLKAWKDGNTGYPFIDAIMTQVRNCEEQSTRNEVTMYDFRFAAEERSDDDVTRRFSQRHAQVLTRLAAVE